MQSKRGKRSEMKARMILALTHLMPRVKIPAIKPLSQSDKSSKTPATAITLLIALTFVAAIMLLSLAKAPIWTTQTQAEFNNGTYVNTTYNTTGFVQLVLPNTTGTYESKVYDANSTVSWKNITWTPGSYYYQQELPNNQQVETLTGGANMTGNVLLMHLNNDTSVGDNTTWTYDYSGLGNNGTITNATWNTSGKFGSALQFDGSNDYVNAGNDTSLNITNAITIETWVYPFDYNGDRYFMSKGDWSDAWGLEVYGDAPNGKGFFFIFSCTGGAVQAYKYGDIMDINKWYHLVATYDTTNGLKAYVNGTLEASASANGGIKSTNKALFIGARNGLYNFFNGIIDEVAIYNRSLSADEILEHYKRGILNMTFQVRSDNDNSSWMNYIGPDNTSSSYFTNVTLANLSLTNLSNARYFQYKAYFETNNTAYTPELWNVSAGYELVEPTVTLNSPNGTYHNTSTITFNCSAVGNGNLVNISLYTNTTGTWQLNMTNNVTGTSNSTNFTVNGIPDGSHAWNCLVYNDVPLSAFASANYTFTVDTTFPQINFTSPTEASGNYINKNYTYVNVSVSDANNVSSFINWNYSLVGYWNFNDGTANDNSTYNNDGTISGATSATGKFGNALGFDGSNDYVNCGTGASLNIATQVTIEAWLYLTGGGWMGVVSKGESTSIKDQNYVLFLGSTTPHLGFGDGTNYREFTGTAIATGWHHIVAVIASSTDMRIYVDGIQQSGTYAGTATTLTPNTKKCLIGADSTTAEFFNSIIDEVRIWNRALSAEEINASYNTGAYRLYHNFTSLADGNYSYYAQTIDLAGNINQTETRTLAIDTTAPSITNMTISPSAAADVDPNVNINVTVNVTDATAGVNTVILRYWNYSTNVSTSLNVIMSSAGGNLFNASFNASVNGTWYYQVWANDTLGNSINNTPNSTNVQYDCTWNISDTISDPTLGTFEQQKSIGNITINNTGDAAYPVHSCNLDFSLTDNLAPGRLTYSPSAVVSNLAAQSNTTINVTATFLSKALSESLVITISEVNRRSATYQTTSNATLTSYAGGPYLNVVINSSPSTVNQTDDLNFTLSAYVQNIGNESASNVTLNWTLPTGWGNVSGNLNLNVSTLNCSDPTISPSSGCTTNTSLNTLTNVITATVSNPNTASIGAVTIYANSSSDSKVNSSCTSNCSYVNSSDSATATVSCYAVSDGVCPTSGTCSYDSTASNYDPDCTAPAATTVTVGGGGGAPGAPAAIVSEATYELVRGKDESFSLEVKNPSKDATLKDIKMSAAGYLAQYISIEPATLDNIQPNSAFNFTIHIIAPAYFTVGAHNLTFTISSIKEVGVMKTANIEKRYVTLAIHELGKEDAAQLITNSKDAIGEMELLGLNIKKAQQLLAESQAELEKSNYENVKELSQSISSIKENALLCFNTIASLQEKIKDAENKGIKAEDTKILLNLAIAASERGDYALALERAKDAEMTYAVETKGEFNIIYFVTNNTLECLIGTIIFTFLSVLLFLKVKLSIINHSLGSLYGEQDILLGLMKTVQHECFAEKKMSMEEYHQSMLEYEDRFSKAVQHALKLESIRANLFRVRKKGLEMEMQGILNLMKELQSQYIKEGKIETRIYNQKMKSLSARLSEIEEQIALNEAQKALRKSRRKMFVRRFGFAVPKREEKLARKKEEAEHKRRKLKEKLKKRFERIVKKEEKRKLKQEKEKKAEKKRKHTQK